MTPKLFSPAEGFARLARGRTTNLRGLAGWAYVAASWVAPWPLVAMRLYTVGRPWRRYTAWSLFLLPFVLWAIWLRGWNTPIRLVDFNDPDAIPERVRSNL